MFAETYEIKVRMGSETAEGLRRLQIAFGLETAEDAARLCLRSYLVENGFIKADAPAAIDLLPTPC